MFGGYVFWLANHSTSSWTENIFVWLIMCLHIRQSGCAVFAFYLMIWCMQCPSFHYVFRSNILIQLWKPWFHYCFILPLNVDVSPANFTLSLPLVLYNRYLVQQLSCFVLDKTIRHIPSVFQIFLLKYFHCVQMIAISPTNIAPAALRKTATAWRPADPKNVCREVIVIPVC